MELPRFDNNDKFIFNNKITMTLTPYEDYCLRKFGELDEPMRYYFKNNVVWEPKR